MNTKRDDFYDRAKEDDPETTIFTGLGAYGTPLPLPRRSMSWGRLALLVLVAVAATAALKLLA